MRMVKQTVICVRHDVIAVQVLKSRAGNGRRRRPWAPTAPRGGELRLEPASPPCPSQWGWTLPCPGQWWQRPSCLQGLASPQVSSHPGFQKLLPWPPPSFSCPAVPRVPVPRCVYLSQARESPRSSLGQKSLFYSPPPPPPPRLVACSRPVWFSVPLRLCWLGKMGLGEQRQVQSSPARPQEHNVALVWGLGEKKREECNNLF